MKEMKFVGYISGYSFKKLKEILGKPEKVYDDKVFYTWTIKYLTLSNEIVVFELYDWKYNSRKEVKEYCTEWNVACTVDSIDIFKEFKEYFDKIMSLKKKNLEHFTENDLI